MTHQVLVQLASVLEYFLTLVTHEVVLLTVSSQVNIEGVGVGEHLATDVTCLQPFPTVQPHVIFQLLFL